MSDSAEQHQHFMRDLDAAQSLASKAWEAGREHMKNYVQQSQDVKDHEHIFCLRDQTRRQGTSSSSICQQCQLHINALTIQADLAKDWHDDDYECAALELLVKVQKGSKHPRDRCKNSTSWDEKYEQLLIRSRWHAVLQQSGRHIQAEEVKAQVRELWSDLAQEQDEQLFPHTLASDILPSLWQTSDTVNVVDWPLTLGTQLMKKEHSSLLWEWSSSQSLDFRKRLLGTWLRRTPEHKAIEHLAPLQKQVALACSRYIQQNDDPDFWTQVAERFIADAERSHAKNDYYGSFLSDQSAMAILLRLYRLHANKHIAIMALTWEKQLYRSIDMHTSMTRSKVTDPNYTPALALLALDEGADLWNQIHEDSFTTSALAQLLMRSTEQLLDNENTTGWPYRVVAALDQYADYLQQSKQKGDCTHAVRVTKEAVELFKSLYKEDATRWQEDYARLLFLYASCLLSWGDNDSRAVPVYKELVEVYKQLYEEDATQWRKRYLDALDKYALRLSESGQEGDSARAIPVSKELVEVYKPLYEKDAAQWRKRYADALGRHAYYLFQSGQKGDSACAVHVRKEIVELYKPLYEKDATQWRERYLDALDKYAFRLLKSGDEGNSTRAVEVRKKLVELYKPLYEEGATQWRRMYFGALANYARSLWESGQEGDSARAIPVYKELVEVYKPLYEEDATQWRKRYLDALDKYALRLSASGQEGDSARAIPVSKELVEVYKPLYEEDATQWRKRYADALGRHAYYLFQSGQKGDSACAVHVSKEADKIGGR